MQITVVSTTVQVAYGYLTPETFSTILKSQFHFIDRSVDVFIRFIHFIRSIALRMLKSLKGILSIPQLDLIPNAFSFNIHVYSISLNRAQCDSLCIFHVP